MIKKNLNFSTNIVYLLEFLYIHFVDPT